MTTRVFVVDDHALVREAIVQVIDLEEDLQVVGDGAGSAATLEAIGRTNPDVLVVDLEMPGIRGCDMIATVRNRWPKMRIVACTMHASYGYVTEALRKGVDGYVLKSSPSAMLLEGIRRVASGQGYIDPALQTDVIRLVHDGAQRLATELTAQEIEVVRLAAEGMSNQEIAHLTGQSVETVKLRLRRCFQKLGAADRANAVALALRRHLIA